MRSAVIISSSITVVILNVNSNNLVHHYWKSILVSSCFILFQNISWIFLFLLNQSVITFTQSFSLVLLFFVVVKHWFHAFSFDEYLSLNSHRKNRLYFRIILLNPSTHSSHIDWGIEIHFRIHFLRYIPTRSHMMNAIRNHINYHPQFHLKSYLYVFIQSFFYFLILFTFFYSLSSHSTFETIHHDLLVLSIFPSRHVQFKYAFIFR